MSGAIGVAPAQPVPPSGGYSEGGGAPLGVVSYGNDSQKGKEDRNLILDAVTVTPA